MKNSVAENKKEALISYIKANSKDNKLTESLTHIGEALGYSNATIHRAVRSLQDSGVLEVIESDIQSKPNTIVFKQDSHTPGVEELLEKGTNIVNRLSAMMQEVHEYVSESNRLMAQLNQFSVQGEDSLVDKVIEKVELPDGKHYMLMVKKEDFDGAATQMTTDHESRPQLN